MSRRVNLDSRMLAAAGLAAITALVVLAATRPEPTTDVLVVASPAAAGTPVAALDLEPNTVELAESRVLSPAPHRILILSSRGLHGRRPCLHAMMSSRRPGLVRWRGSARKQDDGRRATREVT